MSDKEINNEIEHIIREQAERHELFKHIESQAKQLELAVKALERIEDYWEANITVKTYARDALSSINSLSEGRETP